MPELNLDSPQPVRILAVAVGNTRTRFGSFDAGELDRPESVDNHADVAARIAERLAELPPEDRPPVVIASVNRPASDALERALLDALPLTQLLRIGRDVRVPIAVAVRQPERVGVDRLLDSLAAYHRAKQACVVVDVGTALTVNFVDGEGTFQGGAIVPGVRLMLDAMHRGTDALPALPPHILTDLPAVDAEPFGKDTESAMRLGVVAAVRGTVRYLAERFAIAYEAYPQIVATGGDAALLEPDDIVEHFVPDLQLMGIELSCRFEAASDDAPGDDDAAERP